MTTSPDRNPPVIFISNSSGYDLFALDARLLESLGAAEEREQLIEALCEARSRGGSYSPALRRLLVKTPGSIRFVDLDSIDWVGAEGNYVCLHADGATHMMRETMNGVERQLDPSRFVRIHRSTIVNLDRIVEMKPACRGEYEVVLATGQSLKLSRTYRVELERRIGDRL